MIICSSSFFTVLSIWPIKEMGIEAVVVSGQMKKWLCVAPPANLLAWGKELSWPHKWPGRAGSVLCCFLLEETSSWIEASQNVLLSTSSMRWHSPFYWLQRYHLISTSFCCMCRPGECQIAPSMLEKRGILAAWVKGELPCCKCTS